MNSSHWLCVGFLLAQAAIGSSKGEISHALWTAVLRDHVRNGAADYAAIRTDGRFDKYLGALQRTDPSLIRTKEDRLAFWINAYNAFTIKLIIDHYPVKSIRDILRDGKGPWDIVWIEIAGANYSLNQIEHEIIRRQFDEPRIHMALVCAARSCPPLRSEAYVGKRLSEQLEDNARRFLNDRGMNRYDKETNTLYLSELFSWYGDDFATKFGSPADFALKTLGVSSPSRPAVKYLSYDWSLNDGKDRH